jgi:hypothetical protein
MICKPFDYSEMMLERMLGSEAAKREIPDTHAYMGDFHPRGDARFFRIGRKGSMAAKARTMGMELGQLAKTIYFEPEEGGPLYGAVIPGHVKVDDQLLAAAVGVERVKRASYMPEGMCRGSCGPFLSDKDVAKGTVEAIIWDIEDTRQMMDFAVPDREKLTMHMSFDGALRILRERKHPIYHGYLYHHDGAYRAGESLMLQTA